MSAERVGPELERHGIGAVVLLELARRVAAVEVRGVAVVALLAGLALAVAADRGRDRVAAGVAGGAVGRVAGLAAPRVDAAVAAARLVEHAVADADTPVAEQSPHAARPPCVAASHFWPDVAVRARRHGGADGRVGRADVRLAGVGRGLLAGELAVGLAARSGEVLSGPEVALLAGVEGAVAALGRLADSPWHVPPLPHTVPFAGARCRGRSAVRRRRWWPSRWCRCSSPRTRSSSCTSRGS